MKEIKKSVTMKDVARLAGVGVGTVSRVVNNDKGVKKVTLDKVHKAIKELDYLPDAYARGMKINKTETVALIVPTIWHPFFAEFSYYVENELSKQGYKLLLCNIDGDKKEIEYIMDEAGIPCGPVLDVKEAIEHPHTQAREMMVHCEHPTAGDLYFQGCVTKMSETPGVVETPSPLLGEHNREIFGLTEEEEAQLKEEGVI